MRNIKILLILILWGCQQSSEVPTESVTSAKDCTQKTLPVLNQDNVVTVVLSEDGITEYGQVSANRSKGYRFKGQSEQVFNYQTDDNICVWLYSPDNQILNSGLLEKDGNYIVQVSALEGSTTFDIKMSLESVQSSNSQPSSSSNQNQANQSSQVLSSNSSLNERQAIGWIWLGSVNNTTATFSYGESLIPTNKQPVTITPSVVPQPGALVTLKSGVNLRQNVPQPPDFNLPPKVSQPLQTGQQVIIVRLEAFVDPSSDVRQTRVWAAVDFP